MSLAVQTYHIRIMTTYLDYNATSPVLPEVADFVYQLMTEEYGNAGSRTHVFGAKAKAYVEAARGQVAQIVDADKSEVIFTSGATESNNIAILGLKEYALKNNKKHMISLVSDLNGNIIGSDTSPFVINFYIPGVNSEAAMVLMKESIAISNGSACTSSSYKPSHVLTAMGLSDDAVAGSLRISWSHMIKDLPVDAIRNSLLKLM